MLDLTIAEIDALLMHRAAFLANNGQPIETVDPIMEKLSAERARLKKVAEYVAERAAKKAEADANFAYARDEMKPGDVVEFTYTTLVGYGRSAVRKDVTRRMRLTGVDLSRYAENRNLVGVVLTKSGKAHGTLNNSGGVRHEWGVPMTAIKLIERGQQA